MKSAKIALDVVQDVLEMVEKLRNSELKWHLEKTQEYVDGLFSFAKFKSGDKVKLKKTLTFDEGHGWRSYVPTFVVGSTAVIKSVDWWKDRGFVYTVQFDKTLWKDHHGEIEETKRDLNFLMSEKNFSFEGLA